MQPAARLQIWVDAHTGKASANLRRFNGELKASEAQATRSTGAAGKFGKAAKMVGVAAGAAAAYGIYKAVSAGATFEKQMDSLGSVTRATGRQMENLKKQALDLGESTQFTANEVAKAQTELAKGGLTVKQIYGGGVKAALTLAAAGELELAQAAETTVGAMQMFGLKGRDASKIADMLAMAANSTSSDVSDFAMALKQGGSVAKLAGLDMNQTITVLEALAKATIKNSDAGTSMKTAFIQLLKPSTKQAELTKELGINWITHAGTLKDAVGITKELQRATGDMTKAERAKVFGTLAGTDGIRTLNALYDAGVPLLQKYAKANETTGYAAKVAAEKTDNLGGDLEELSGALESKAIPAYEKYVPYLRAAVQWTTGLVRSTDKLSIQELAQKLGIGRKELKQFGEAGRNAAAIFNKYVWPVVKSTIGMMIKLLQDFALVVRGVVRIIAGILTGDFGLAWKGVKDIFRGGVDGAIQIIRGVTKPLRMIAAAIGGGMADAFGAAWDKIKDIFSDGVEAVIDKVNSVIDVINIIPGIPDIDPIGAAKRKGQPPGIQGPVGQHRYSGGAITKPMAIVGEEAPRHHEWVIATNPAYKKANLSYWAQAGADLGVPGFAVGGLVGKAAGAVGDLAGGVAGKGAGFFIDKLPKPDLPDPFASLGPYLIAQVSDYIQSGFDEKKFGQLVGGPSGAAFGPRGIGTYKGVPMANWVIESLQYAASKGAAPQPTSGYRSHAQNVSEGRNYKSEHEGTQYPYGAVDFGGYTTGLAAKMSVVNATRNFKYPLLAPIGFEDDGHASGTGHFMGGLMRYIKHFAEGGFMGSGYTVKGIAASARQMHTAGEIMEAADATGAGHLPRVASMMAATQESAMGATGNTFQLTTDFEGVSPSDRAYKQAVQWFTKGYYHGGGIGLAKKFSDPGDIAQEVEGSAYPDAYDPWKREGQRWTDGWGGKGSASGKTEDVPAVYRGARTGSLSFGAIPKSLHGIEKELSKRRGEVALYRKAAKDAHKKGKAQTEQAITGNLRELESRVRELERARAKERREIAKRKIVKRLGKALGKLTGFEDLIAAKERSFDAKSQFAEQLVALEPIMPEIPEKATELQREAIEKGHVDNLTRYVQTQEEPAYQALLGSAGEWRNTILSGQEKAAGNWQKRKTLGGLEGNWEDKIIATVNQIDHSQDFAKKVSGDVATWRKKHGKDPFPKWLKAAVKKADEDRAHLPILRFQERELRKVLGEGREHFYPGKARIQNPPPPYPGSGSLEEALQNVQGIHWPAQHEKLASLPVNRVAGMFGGVIWDVQSSIAELGMKIRDAAVGGGASGEEDAGNSERLAFIEEQLRQANQRNLVFERQKPIIDRYESIGKFAGMFAKGGSIPAGMWGIAGERGPEVVQGPAQVFSNSESSGMAGAAPSLHVHVYPDGRVEAELNGKQIQQVETIFEKQQKRQGRGSRSIGASRAGRLG